MKRIILFLLVLILACHTYGEDSNADLLKQVEEQVKPKFLDGDAPLRYSSNILINKHFGSRFVVKMDDSNQTKLLSGRGYCEQVKNLMEI
ncbi:MAG TPA: hypothetical protein VFC65_15980 [Prolixibacteraceae bacterium]|nr:hypothetical protein [Prolixibacteraceae bacterium]